MVLHLLKMEKEEVARFSEAISTMRERIQFCSQCHNVSDTDVCAICSNPSRNASIICVVETIRDVIAIENTQQYNGLYHVLGGVISPLDGVGPEELQIASLLERLQNGQVQEVIMAISPTIEGDTTIYFISRKLKDLAVRITTIARGIAFGGELEYADEMTLARSLVHRLPIETSDNQ